jgi:hypothetical protein
LAISHRLESQLAHNPRPQNLAVDIFLLIMPLGGKAFMLLMQAEKRDIPLKLIN